MAIYTPDKFTIPSGLDEIGLRLGLRRFEHESQSEYRARLLLEARDRSGPTEREFLKSLSRRVGETEIPVFEVDVIRDVNDDPLAVDPYIEITSTHMRAYSDWNNKTLDFELNLVDRADAYFLREVDTALTGSSFFSHTVLDSGFTYKRSDKLRYGNTERFVSTEFFYNSRSNKLKNAHIRDIHPSGLEHFQEEVGTLAAVDGEGKFYIDYVEGTVFTYEPATGYVAYAHREFPFRMWWSEVRAWPYNDADVDYLHKDTLIADDTGIATHLLLNSKGSSIANEVLELHPLGWGE